ncbi:MAG: MaoC/PaaZ C-terminal domain-containing protein [Desulfobacula sp.]|jgi:3-hydroxybutyryl-CoA dehydratase|nr:MaoC/PaaZ C-terminal domain-containing protein [Desulfobacula sp.]
MANPIRLKAINGLKPGDSFIYQRRFTKKETLLFGDMTRDYNPVHYDERWTKEKGFKELICHGLLVGSMLCEFGGQVGWLATGMNFKFIYPVYFGDTIQCSVTITKIQKNSRAEAEAVFINQDKIQVCSAHMTGRLPMEKEKAILRTMVKEGDPTNQLTEESYPLKP